MRSSVVFSLLLVSLYAVVEGSEGHRQGGSLASRFAELDAVKGLDPKHRQLFQRVVQEFERTIDESNLDLAHKDAAKQKSLDHFMGRLAEQKLKLLGY